MLIRSFWWTRSWFSVNQLSCIKCWIKLLFRVTFHNSVRWWEKEILSREMSDVSYGSTIVCFSHFTDRTDVKLMHAHTMPRLWWTHLVSDGFAHLKTMAEKCWNEECIVTHCVVLLVTEHHYELAFLSVFRSQLLPWLSLNELRAPTAEFLRTTWADSGVLQPAGWHWLASARLQR